MSPIAAVFLTPLDCSDTDSRAPEISADCARQFVRLTADAVAKLSDADLQTYILRCAEEFLAAHRRWEQFGNFADVGDRDAWWHAEADALRERGNRPEVVTRMERRLGLA